MRRVRIFVSFFSAILFIFLASCESDPESSSARLRISLTDASTISLKEFALDIQKIEVNVIDTIDGSPEKWIKLDFNPKIYNLLAYANGKSERLVDQFFPSGGLMNIRIFFGSESYLKLTEKPNDKVKLNVSSQLQTDGLLINMDTATTIYPSAICSVMLDINALTSIEALDGEYHFRPSIRAFPETYGATLKGFVKPAEAYPYVVITQGANQFVTWAEATDGLFLFSGLKAGAWDVEIIPTDPAGIYEGMQFSDTLKNGEVLNLNTITLKTKKPEENNSGGGSE